MLKLKKVSIVFLFAVIAFLLFSCKKKEQVETYQAKNDDVGIVVETNESGKKIKTYIDSKNEKITNKWVQTADKTYFVDEKSEIVTGINYIDNNEYYFNVDGTLQTQDFNNGNYHYTVNSDGTIKDTEDLNEYKSKINPVSPSNDYDNEYENKAISSGNTSYYGINNNQKSEIDNFVNDFYNNYIDGKIEKTDENWKFKREIEIVKWLVENTEYDNENYYNKTIPQVDYTAYAALINKKAVCSGFAKAFTILAEKCDIEVKYVRGDNHAWNIVKLDDGNWYHVDATWAICTGNYANYVNLTDEQCRNLENGAGGINNHAFWDVNIPATGTKFGYDFLIDYLKKEYGIIDRYNNVIVPQATDVSTQAVNVEKDEYTIAIQEDDSNYKDVDFNGWTDIKIEKESKEVVGEVSTYYFIYCRKNDNKYKIPKKSKPHAKVMYKSFYNDNYIFEDKDLSFAIGALFDGNNPQSFSGFAWVYGNKSMNDFKELKFTAKVNENRDKQLGFCIRKYSNKIIHSKTGDEIRDLDFKFINNGNFNNTEYEIGLFAYEAGTENIICAVLLKDAQFYISNEN